MELNKPQRFSITEVTPDPTADRPQWVRIRLTMIGEPTEIEIRGLTTNIPQRLLRPGGVTMIMIE